MKRFATKLIASTLAFVVAFAPIVASAAELRKTEYNPKVTTSSGKLKLGYHETNDSSKTWWKTETYYTDWKEATEAEYNAVKDDDLKMVDTSATTDWRDADYDTYKKYVASNPDNARTNGYTDYVKADKATFDSYPEDLRKSAFGDWQVVDKATYDAETDPDKKSYNKSDWTTIGDPGNWVASYDKWLTYPEGSRRASPLSDFYEVTKEDYLDFASKFPGYENVLYKYEEGAYQKLVFEGWPYFDEQIIANVYNANNGHDPFYILVGELNASNYMAEGGTWDGNNDGVRYLNDSNGGSAQNIAEGTLNMLNANGIPYVTISSDSEIPFGLGPDKFNQHVNDPSRNAGGGGNDFIDIVDEDFKIYYYGGEGTLNVEGFYGILIAPYATVNVGGKWIGTIIADTVNGAGNWFESAKWNYPYEKGEVDRKYYICQPLLEVIDECYMVRSAEYYVRDYIYQVRDVVKKYYVRGTEDKIYYCEASPYVPQTGDIDLGLILSSIVCVVTAGCILIIVSKKKEREKL